LPVLAALAAALGFGLSDFVAGVLSRRASVFLVAAVGQTTSAALTWIATPLAGGAPSGGALLWGAISGIGATSGAMFLYRGLARGRMSVVGPVSAVITAAGSAAAGIVLGDRPTTVQLAGMALACTAVALVSLVDDGRSIHDSRELRRSLFNAFAAGLGFILFFVALNRAGNNAGLLPVAMSQSGGLVLALGGAVVALGTRHASLVELRRLLPIGSIVGLLGGGATAAYFVATHIGLLSVSAVITSLYPAATIVPAVVLLHERVRRRQAIGLVLAAVSVALLAV